ncbi:hypothetical protein WR25_25455 [Diploscapter pachys]|uniref:Uncharacterized protein n=1 Tax=Diploscapter pachys TaxID=2018661 RepID=A0A2A2JP82_9BILA|nr:hypothetical protein WR25_25455 [Diploscapter pachys]
MGKIRENGICVDMEMREHRGSGFGFGIRMRGFMGWRWNGDLRLKKQSCAFLEGLEIAALILDSNEVGSELGTFVNEDFGAFEGTLESRRRKVANSAGVAYAKRLLPA